MSDDNDDNNDPLSIKYFENVFIYRFRHSLLL